MTVEEAKQIAKVLRFPPANHYSVPEEYTIIDLPNKENSNYLNFSLNGNHFIPEYHKEVVIPKLEELLDFKVDDSFVWTIRKVNNGNSDLGFYRPVNPNNYMFSAYCITTGEEKEGNFDILTTCVDTEPSHTDYHRVYCYPHRCSRIINLTNDTDRRLLLCGDSQLLPEIALLACFFKEVWYLDKRYGNFSAKELFKNIEFTHVLFEVGGSSFSMILNSME